MSGALKLIVSFFLLLPLLCGCGKKTETNNSDNTNSGPTGESGPSNFLVGLKTTQLSFPEGWKQFKNDVQDAQIKLGIEKKPLSDEELQKLAERAREFSKSAQRGHAHDVGLIPKALILCGQSAALAGNAQQALQLLGEANSIGIVEKDGLEAGHFDAIRETEDFEKIKPITLDEAYGKYLVREPLFDLKELLSANTDPAMPSESDHLDKITVIFTGPQMTLDAVKTLKEAKQAGALVHAIVANGSGETDGDVPLHITNLSPEQLRFDNSAITWFANKQGQVVAFLRPFSGDGVAKAIVTSLSAQ